MGATKRLTHFNNQPIIRATITLQHYNIKKRVEWYIGQKNIIYTMYIIIYYPTNPEKKSIFQKV